MKQTISLSCFLIFSMVSCFFVQQHLSDKREEFLKASYMAYTLPSKITGLLALEFKGIVSDFLFLKTTTFFGDKFIKQESVSEKQADYAYESIKIITDLDPWFWDAYLFADMLLTWDFGQIDQANDLLLKARSNRTWDFKPGYYLGFNHFYFLKDNKKGSRFLMEASKIPGAPSYLASLAARLSMYDNQYTPAIVFLNEILKTTQNQGLKKQYEKRLKTLVIMDKLEKNVHAYQAALGSFPETLQNLVDKGFIESIPDDPYGGQFILLKNKRVYTTSKMLLPKKKK